MDSDGRLLEPSKPNKPLKNIAARCAGGRLRNSNLRNIHSSNSRILEDKATAITCIKVLNSPVPNQLFIQSNCVLRL